MASDAVARKLANLRRLLAPQSLAFVGGERALGALAVCKAAGFGGRLYAVHPRHREVEGLPCLPAVAALPEAPDGVFLAVNRETTVEVVGELARRGVAGIVCYASGFAELDGDGAALQQRLVEAAGDSVLVGPNCMGVINYVSGGSLWPLPYPPQPWTRGGAVVAQSGNVCINLCMSQRSLPFSYLISIGNQANLAFEDVIEALVDDPAVTAIGLFLEGLEDVCRFGAAALRALKQGKPIVALKLGSSAIGAESAISHTSTLAGSPALYDALFERLGVLPVASVPAMIETLKLATVWEAQIRRDGGGRLAAFASSGGDAGLVADYAEPAGLALPAPDANQAASVARLLPSYARVANPLDFTADYWGEEEKLRQIFIEMMGRGCDAALLVVDHPRPELDMAAPVEAMVRALTAARDATGVPAALATVNPESLPEDLRRRMIADAIAPLQGLHDAVAALASLERARARRAAYARDGWPPPLLPGDQARHGAADLVLDEQQSKAALRDHGITVPEGRLAALQEVASVAEELGFPLVVKALSPELPHKSEAGAVVLDISDAAMAETAARDMARALKARRPPLAVERFLLERMVKGAVAEVILGVKREPPFGPALVLGAGGALVELLRDSRILLLPTYRREVEAALRALSIFPLLQGYRGHPAGDLEALVEAAMALAGFAADHRERLVELDINPLLVMPAGQGVVAADAVIRLRT